MGSFKAKKGATKVKLPKSFRTTVGMHAAEGAQQHQSSGLTMAALLAVHEHGSSDGRIPQRAPVRSWFDSKQQESAQIIRSAVRRGVDAPEVVALRMQASIQKHIADGVPPPNAPSTIARKGSSKPLIDEGLLRAGLTARSEVKE